MTEKDYIVVAVSIFYNGYGWTDAATGVQFLPQKTIAPIRISKKKDLSGIYNSYRMNNLLLLEGNFDKEATLDIESLNPEQLTKDQFQKIIKRLKTEQVFEGGNEKLEEEKQVLLKEKESLAKELDELKDLFFKTHTFTAEELKDSFYTVEILKDVLTKKEIIFTEKENKTALKKKLVG